MVEERRDPLILVVSLQPCTLIRDDAVRDSVVLREAIAREVLHLTPKHLAVSIRHTFLLATFEKAFIKIFLLFHFGLGQTFLR